MARVFWGSEPLPGALRDAGTETSKSDLLSAQTPPLPEGLANAATDTEMDAAASAVGLVDYERHEQGSFLRDFCRPWLLARVKVRMGEVLGVAEHR